MKIDFLLTHAFQFIETTLKYNHLKDYPSNDYFRINKGIGSKERYVVNELAYFSLRNYLLLNNLFENIPFSGNYFTKKKCLLFVLLLIKGENVISRIDARVTNITINFREIITEYIENHADLNQIRDAVNSYINELSEKSLKSEPDIHAISTLYSVTPVIVTNLLKIFTKHELRDILLGINDIPNFEIRANTLISDTDLSLKNLEQNGISCQKHDLAPDCIIITKRVNLNELSLYKSGGIEVQSAGSQCISLLSYYPDANNILDACAGAGGKSLHLAAISENKSAVTALDTDNRKILELDKRAERAGAKNIVSHTIKPFSAEIINNSKFDLILIDAPCSGTGISSRDPIKKLFLTAEKIKKYSIYQSKLINYYSDFLVEGGRLVYATCSILPEENEFVIDKFLKNNQAFEAFEPNENIETYNLDGKLSSVKTGYYRVHPLHNDTDGFFIAVLRKKAK